MTDSVWACAAGKVAAVEIDKADSDSGGYWMAGDNVGHQRGCVGGGYC